MMDISLIFRPDKMEQKKLHIAELVNGKFRPYCGGGRDARSVPFWQTDIGGIEACTCYACILKLARKEGVS